MIKSTFCSTFIFEILNSVKWPKVKLGGINLTIKNFKLETGSPQLVAKFQISQLTVQIVIKRTQSHEIKFLRYGGQVCRS